MDEGSGGVKVGVQLSNVEGGSERGRTHSVVTCCYLYCVFLCYLKLLRMSPTQLVAIKYSHTEPFFKAWNYDTQVCIQSRTHLLHTLGSGSVFLLMSVGIILLAVTKT